jgi:mono/diheme cytochrome c family protein
MKRRLAWMILTSLALLILAACNSPQPLPKAPTPIATLPPATLPPPGPTATPRAAVVGVTFPAQPPSAQAGQAVYQAKCASCHGADGKGKVEKARNFNDEDYLRGAAPAEFYQVITNGLEQMPGFKTELSDADRWNVTFFLWSFSVKPDRLAKGKTVYEANCVACHGPDGKGLIPQAAKLGVEFVGSFPATQFYQSVSGGKGIMPAWQDRLSADDRWAAVEYARAFAYQPLK